MKKKYKIFIHILFWFYMINQSLFPLYLNKVDSNNLQDLIYLKDIFISIVLNVLIFYSVYLTIPYFVKIRKRQFLVPLILLSVIILAIARFGVEYAIWKYIVRLPAKELIIKSYWVWNTLRITIVIATYATLIRFSIYWVESQQKRDELVKQQQAGEIALLRSQINPHFLFNTLNNIYSLVYNKSNEAPEAVMKLSSIMRYMLYDSNSDQVPLEKEIEYLTSFIELQQLRLAQKDFVEMKIIDSSENRYISPMLLIPFVENAFKHGDKKHKPGIIIFLNLETDKMTFHVKNYVKPGDNELQKEESSGFGMKNIERRLNLLYPDKHTLTIEKQEKTFEVNLTILDK